MATADSWQWLKDALGQFDLRKPRDVALQAPAKDIVNLQDDDDDAESVTWLSDDDSDDDSDDSVDSDDSEDDDDDIDETYEDDARLDIPGNDDRADIAEDLHETDHDTAEETEVVSSHALPSRAGRDLCRNEQVSSSPTNSKRRSLQQGQRVRTQVSRQEADKAVAAAVRSTCNVGAERLSIH